jgi:hypothetical protein
VSPKAWITVKEIEPEMGIPVALMTSCRRAGTSNGCVPPRHSDSSLTTLGPQSVNTGRGRFEDNIMVRRTCRCCADWNLARVNNHNDANREVFYRIILICLTRANTIPGRVQQSSGPRKYVIPLLSVSISSLRSPKPRIACRKTVAAIANSVLGRVELIIATT